MERLINRRQQGDLGEASAIEWLTRQGATLFTPLGHSPDVDLVADFGGRAIRVQVKTTTFAEERKFGVDRWQVMIATNGGNQSWSKLTKRFAPARVDYLFVLVGDGRRWFLPSGAVEATTNISLGGPKYSEFEIDSAPPLTPLVYGGSDLELDSGEQGEYRSGQTGCAVNALAQSFVGSNPASPISPAAPSAEAAGTTRIWGKRRVTLPLSACEATGLKIGDRLRVEALGDGSIRLTRIESPSAGNVTP